ncbi:flavodoxin family protein [Anaerotalea alkaliphila]|uniref:Flavodoxin family protein n=1 Tax=Anaerotalea alkaliphila TaxID=2662126 RepID=A0A7X5HV35_9FIRM|nr:flavodoxin family protein [Anaerotalea alkaliphila]NDL67183.1 flavodoxin family protein [Anaerotalea alkaliphila]
MKVMAFNGSPNEHGNTRQALEIVGEELRKADIGFEVVHVGDKVLSGCTACHGCIGKRDGTCILGDDGVNGWIGKMREADGILFGSPVHFASMGGSMKAFLDRAFFVSVVNGNLFRHKVGAGLAVVRRTGGLPTVDLLQNYLNTSEMLIPTSCYWNVIHGKEPGEVMEDVEGVQTLRILGKNMAWLLQLVDNGKDSVRKPAAEEKVFQNFIR